MFFIIGFVIVFGSVVGGYLALGGHLGVLWQPFEFVIIGGAAIGAFLISNPKPVIGGVAGSFGKILSGPKYTKDAYLELLSVLYSVFRLAKSKGDLALEAMSKSLKTVRFSRNSRSFPRITTRWSSCATICAF